MTNRSAFHTDNGPFSAIFLDFSVSVAVCFRIPILKEELEKPDDGQFPRA